MQALTFILSTVSGAAEFQAQLLHLAEHKSNDPEWSQSLPNKVLFTDLDN